MTSDRPGDQRSAASQSLAGRIVLGFVTAGALLLGATALIAGALFALHLGAPSWVVALGGIAVLVAVFVGLQKAAGRGA